MKDCHFLLVRHKAHGLALAIYGESATLPREEIYGLTGQIRRVALSIPTNIAEGCGRGTDGDFARFLQTGMGSASELEYLIEFAREMRFRNDDTCRRLTKRLTESIEEIQRMLASLIGRVRS